MRTLVVLVVLLSLPGPVRADYQPVAERLIDNVYAVVGPLGQRSRANDGLNANYGFVVTPAGVILIDSGASRLGAQRLEAAIKAVTDRPVRWVINTGSQDHRWLGNAHFAAQGAEILALARTAEGQGQYGAQQMEALAGFLGDRLEGTQALPATHPLSGDEVTVQLGGETLVLRYTDAHFPGDAWLWLPERGILFTGDLVYVDRLLGVLQDSSVRNGQRAFRDLADLNPRTLVPGHGRVCDLDQARRESGDYYDFLVDTVGAAARDMEPLDATLDRYADLPQFRHLENYQSLHRTNMSRAFTQLEGQ